MKQKLVDFELQARVRKYLEHLWLEEEIEDRETEIRIIDKLSTSLREELLIQSQGRVLAQFSLFTDFFSEAVLEEVSQKVNTVSYAPEDIILYVLFFTRSLIIFKYWCIHYF
jgi:superfamily I DNA and/or RNA helicase